MNVKPFYLSEPSKQTQLTAVFVRFEAALSYHQLVLMQLIRFMLANHGKSH
ncbi:hypothetical protein VCHA52P453_110015 [Vibrio chagasii]|nr:hypothetical protein VCHA39P226_120015 [Vibrio chagasii]CAH6929826.1 hypothetical protein VCHA52P453_110015 [Vibrio chagasii]CAH7299420.1 hypothetical protein VCHA52P456_40015 [Vibrio chagasii]